MYDITQQLLARVCSAKFEQFVWIRKGVPNKRCCLATEQTIKSFKFMFLVFHLYFKSTFTIKIFMNVFWNDFSRTPHDGCFC